MLLHGPPGTGKTSLAKKCAYDTGVNLFTVNGPELVSQYYGESEKALHEVFDSASRATPAVVRYLFLFAWHVNALLLFLLHLKYIIIIELKIIFFFPIRSPYILLYYHMDLWQWWKVSLETSILQAGLWCLLAREVVLFIFSPVHIIIILCLGKCSCLLVVENNIQANGTTWKLKFLTYGWTPCMCPKEAKLVSWSWAAFSLMDWLWI